MGNSERPPETTADLNGEFLERLAAIDDIAGVRLVFKEAGIESGQPASDNVQNNEG